MISGSGETAAHVKVFIRTGDKKARGLILPSEISGN